MRSVFECYAVFLLQPSHVQASLRFLFLHEATAFSNGCFQELQVKHLHTQYRGKKRYLNLKFFLNRVIVIFQAFQVEERKTKQLKTTHRHERLLLRICSSTVATFNVLIVVQVLPIIFWYAVFGFDLRGRAM